jgi:hypothetical protein
MAEEVTKTSNLIEELYKKLSLPIPEEYLFEYEEGGRTFTGYHGQYAINLLNQVCGLDSWKTDEEILKQEMLKGSWIVAMKVAILISKVGIKNPVLVTGYGASYAKRADIAYKSAKTNAFKNACRYLGIGNELYLKGFEDEVIYEDVMEDITDSPSLETEELNDLANRIERAENVEQLQSLESSVKQVKGKSTLKLLTEKYNNKKIKLMEGK